MTDRNSSSRQEPLLSSDEPEESAAAQDGISRPERHDLDPHAYPLPTDEEIRQAIPARILLDPETGERLSYLDEDPSSAPGSKKD